MKKIIFFSFLLCLSFSLSAQKHWETIVSGNDTWSYLPTTSAPPANWNQPGFDASTWKTGKGGFGYADNDDSTVIASCNSVYIRKTFKVYNTAMLDQLLLDIDFDDAFVCYLNGKEVARSSNITAVTPLFNSALTIDHEAKLYQGLAPERYILKLSDLITGENTIAIQVLNANASSTDLSALAFLFSKVNSSGLIYKALPTWFATPFESNLPVVFIDTQGQTILNEPKITAKMKVINNPTGINSPIDTLFEYNGFIGIETRGSSSQMFEKKSFVVETRTDSATNLNVSLLGLPKENDWILYAPYTDKSMIRNVLAYRMGNMTGKWSPRTRYCEVFINNEYRGVYVLVEKIKIDKNRLNLGNVKPNDTIGDGLTGGYILKIDRPDSGNWVSPYKARNDIQAVPISYVDPECNELNLAQKEYIKNHITAFETALRSSNYTDPVAGYRPYVDITSFVDYYIINEISRNLDGNRVSTFFYKDKDSKGGKITMGPFWDYNIAFGNANFFSAGNTTGWTVDGVGNGDEYGITFWWDKFRLDPYFNSRLRNRWDELRSSKFSNSNLTRIVDSCATVLAEPQKRNFVKFNILSTYIWPNNYVGKTYANEVTYLKNWVITRLAWMDSQIGLLDGVDMVNDLNQNYEIIAYPNPFSTNVSLNFKLKSAGQVNVVIHDMLGKTISNRTEQCAAGENEFRFNGNEINSGGNLYFYKISINGEMIGSGKILKKQ